MLDWQYFFHARLCQPVLSVMHAASSMVNADLAHWFPSRRGDCHTYNLRNNHQRGLPRMTKRLENSPLNKQFNEWADGINAAVLSYHGLWNSKLCENNMFTFFARLSCNSAAQATLCRSGRKQPWFKYIRWIMTAGTRSNVPVHYSWINISLPVWQRHNIAARSGSLKCLWLLGRTDSTLSKHIVHLIPGVWENTSKMLQKYGDLGTFHDLIALHSSSS